MRTPGSTRRANDVFRYEGLTITTKVALITRANRGLGFETARALSRSGVTAIIGSRDGTKGERAADELRGEDLKAGSVALDGGMG